MSEMVDCAAKALLAHEHGTANSEVIWQNRDEDTRNVYRRRVCAIIRAMREPTEEMLRIGLSAVVAEPHADPADTCWRAMITAALA